MNNKVKITYGKKISWIILVVFIFSLLYATSGIKTTAIESSTTTINELNPEITNPTLVSPSPNPTTANIGDNNINVKYNFNLKPGDAFYSEIKSSPIDEVMFLVDESNNINDQIQADYFYHVIVNWIVDKDNMKNIKMGLIGMSDKPVLLRGDNEKDKYKDIGMDLSNANLLNINNDNVADVIKQRANEIKEQISIKQPNVMDSLVCADNILQNEGEKNKNKAIVLIVSNDFQYNESKIEMLKNRGYKIITVDVSYDKQENKNIAEKNLKSLFNYLGGYGNNYIVGKYEEGGNSAKYNSPDNEGEQLNQSLANGMSDKSFRLSNLKFNFDLGEGFSPVNNSTAINFNTTANNSTIINSIHGDNFNREESLGNNRYSLTIPDIEFKCEIVENPCNDDSSKIKVKYTPAINNQLVDRGNFSVNFSVKFVKYTSDNPVVFGTKDTVGTNNYFSYNNSNNTLAAPLYISTPAVKGILLDIVHGIYVGKVDGEQKIDDTNVNNTFAKGSVVTMAAKFKITAQTNLQLILDKDLSCIGIPKVYKILEDGSLKLLGEMNSSNKYTVNESDKGNIIVIYSVSLSKDKEKIYENTIKVGEQTKDAIIKGTETLPDLF